MTTSRVPLLPVDEAKAAADEAGVPDYMAELSIFQVLLNHPRLARTFNDLLATMLWHGTLDSRLRELVIMRIGWLTDCDYEWTQHWRVASGLGVSADDLLGVRDWQGYNGFGPAEQAVLAATDDVVREGAVSAQSWSACERELHCDKVVLIELVTSDKRMANGRFDPAQPRGPTGRRRFQLAARRPFAKVTAPSV